MSKIRPNMRKNNKYAEARAWAFDMIADSPNTLSTDMADMMAEQFKVDRKAMQHTLSQMARVGILKVVNTVVHNGKNTHVLSANKRTRSAPQPIVVPPFPGDERPLPAPVPTAPNGSGVYVLINTVNGPVQLTVEQAKALNEGLSGLFK